MRINPQLQAQRSGTRQLYKYLFIYYTQYPQQQPTNLNFPPINSRFLLASQPASQLSLHARGWYQSIQSSYVSRYISLLSLVVPITKLGSRISETGFGVPDRSYSVVMKWECTWIWSIVCMYVCMGPGEVGYLPCALWFVIKLRRSTRYFELGCMVVIGVALDWMVYHFWRVGTMSRYVCNVVNLVRCTRYPCMSIANLFSTLWSSQSLEIYHASLDLMLLVKFLVSSLHTCV